MASGLLFRSIHTLNECTSCHPKQFFSYRKSGGRTGRMMSVIGLTER
jgi:copper oxidase (laccase) domain-containing protein